jgi:hypothetical protein
MRWQLLAHIPTQKSIVKTSLSLDWKKKAMSRISSDAQVREA